MKFKLGVFIASVLFSVLGFPRFVPPADASPRYVTSDRVIDAYNNPYAYYEFLRELPSNQIYLVRRTFSDRTSMVNGWYHPFIALKFPDDSAIGVVKFIFSDGDVSLNLYVITPDNQTTGFPDFDLNTLRCSQSNRQATGSYRGGTGGTVRFGGGYAQFLCSDLPVMLGEID